MTRPGHHGDAGKRFEQELRDVVARFDPVPEAVKSRARSVARAQAPENSVLLALVCDSVLDVDVVLSGDTPIRVLSFAGGGLRLEVMVDPAGGQRRLSGWTIPVAALGAALRTESAITSLPLRDDGSFSADRINPTQVSIVVEAALDGARRTFHSSWFSP